LKNFDFNRFLAKQHLEILQKEISGEANLWFGATWDSKIEEYISDKGNSVIILRAIPTSIYLGVQSRVVYNQKYDIIVIIIRWNHFNRSHYSK